MGNGLEGGCLQHSSERPSGRGVVDEVTQTQMFQLTLKNSAVKPCHCRAVWEALTFQAVP